MCVQTESQGRISDIPESEILNSKVNIISQEKDSRSETFFNFSAFNSTIFLLSEQGICYELNYVLHDFIC